MDASTLARLAGDPAGLMRSAAAGHRFANALLGDRALQALPEHFRPGVRVGTGLADGVAPAKSGASQSKELGRGNNEFSAPVMTIDIKAQFREALEALGLVVDGDPVMDGTMQRVPVLREDQRKPRNRDGAYVGHLDGRPAGWIKNFHTQETTRWKARAELSDEQRRAIRREAAARRAEAEHLRQVRYEHHGRRSRQFIALLPAATSDHPYLKKKGIAAAKGIYLDRKGNLIVPFHGISGEIRGFQRIGPGGFKQIKKGTRKAGAMHVIGAEWACLNKGKILIAEGYATGKSLADATGLPVVVAFDAYNLQEAVRNLRKAYPGAALVIAADDDQGRRINVGREQALKAQSVGQTAVVFPTQIMPGPHGDDFNDQMRQGRGQQIKRLVDAAMREQKQSLSDVTALNGQATNSKGRGR